MKISLSLIEKLLNLLLIIVEFVKKQQDKDDEEENRNREIASLARRAHPGFDDNALAAYYEKNISTNEILNNA